MWRTSSTYFIKNDRPLVMAHRGDSANVPENTEISFREAAKLKVDVIETDVHITKDNHLVFFHDSKLNRTTNSKGKVTEFTLDELEQLDMGYWFDPEENKTYPHRGKGLKIQTVEKVLKQYPNMRFNMDIKDKLEHAPETLANLLQELNAEERVQVGSFHQKQIIKFRKYSQSPTSAGPFETYNFIKKAKKYIKKHKNSLIEQEIQSKTDSEYREIQKEIFGNSLEYVSLTIPMGVPLSSFEPIWKFVTPDTIKFAHHVGIAMFVWTINGKQEMETLLEWNIDGIFTDKPGLLLEILK